MLTDDGGLAQRIMRSSVPRYYTLRLRGQIDEKKLKKLEEGITVRGVHYRPLKASLAAKQEGTNAWVNVVVREGMNREVRRGVSCETICFKARILIFVSSSSVAAQYF